MKTCAKRKDWPGKSTTWFIDRALQDVMVPFNERTASSSVIVLPRGSVVHAPVPAGKFIRLFLHWCEPESSRYSTDLDLSVGFYDKNWNYKGVCSYYELQCKVNKKSIAKSSGDFTSAPYPKGASEFVDVDLTEALNANIRYAVMIVNAYSGLTFNELERAFAGYMVREDSEGKYFDARTVEMKFNLQGAQGIYMPVVFDFVQQKLHWLDVYSRGMPALNNVSTSNKAVQRICPDMIAYFASGTRMSMYELALLHAAARGQEVILRGDNIQRFKRRTNETSSEFLQRLRYDTGTEYQDLSFVNNIEVMGVIFRGNLQFSPKSKRYVLFPETITGNLSASDFIV